MKKASRARANALLRQRVADLHTEVDRAFATQFEQERAKSGLAVTCKKGCNACCEMATEVTTLEAELIAARNPKAVAQALPKLREHAALAASLPGDRDVGVDAWWALRVSCAFLVDGLCSVYAERPYACRSYFVVSDPALCAERPQVKVAQVNTKQVDPQVAARLLRLSKEDGRERMEYGLLPLMILRVLGVKSVPMLMEGDECQIR